METSVNSTGVSNVEPPEFCPAKTTKALFAVWVAISSLWVPIYLLVFYIGFKKWKKRRNFSNSDVFTFNIVLTQFCANLGSVMLLIGMFTNLQRLVLDAGRGLIFFDGFEQMFFHSFTCVDRYLAAVRPVNYLRLKQQSAVRNVIVSFVWPLCIAHIVASFYIFLYQVITGILIPCLTLTVVTFCTIAVLRVLVRPKPGDTAKCSDKTKRQAFYTIAFILATLVLRFTTETIFFATYLFGVFGNDSCFFPVVCLWFGLPSSLVLPLLFLYRAGVMKTRRNIQKA